MAWEEGLKRSKGGHGWQAWPLPMGLIRFEGNWRGLEGTKAPIN